MRPVILAPSILASNFQNLGDQVSDALEAGAKYIHVDVMDGRFVPNISIGIPIVEAVAPLTKQARAVCDVHLMIIEPEKFIIPFAQAGADLITIHVEATPHVHRAIQQIKGEGIKAGVALNPATPLSILEEILPLVDVVLVMSVNPGFGGQSYIPGSTKKIQRLAQILREKKLNPLIEVDGGIKTDNAAAVVSAGADILIAGSAIFNDQQSVAENMAAFSQVITTARSISV